MNARLAYASFKTVVGDVKFGRGGRSEACVLPMQYLEHQESADPLDFKDASGCPAVESRTGRADLSLCEGKAERVSIDRLHTPAQRAAAVGSLVSLL
jgi:hypothetical protein